MTPLLAPTGSRWTRHDGGVDTVVGECWRQVGAWGLSCRYIEYVTSFPDHAIRCSGSAEETYFLAVHRPVGGSR